MAEALRKEEAVVFSTALESLGQDLDRVALDLDESGDWQSGDRTQSVQADVERGLQQLIEALKAERQRREDENRDKNKDKPPEGKNQQEKKEPLVADSAELKLLASMENDTVRNLTRLLALYPELSTEGAQVDPLVLRDVQRLAEQHERTTRLFAAFRKRLGLPDPTQQ
jgi:hypothetical protein